MHATRLIILAGIAGLITAPASAEQGLHISKATYGVVNSAGTLVGAFCDATPNMAQACNGKEFCQLYVDPRYMCPDPAHGIAKVVSVEHSCNGKPQETLMFPDTAQALLRCPTQ